MDTQPLKGIKVMLVDDSPTILKLGASFLESVGCEVMGCDDGYDALANVNEFLPDIIFVDVVMERIDGYSTCAIIKSNPNLKRIPLIMLSSKNTPFDVAKGKISGATEYLSKPFEKESLLDAISRNLINVSEVSGSSTRIAQ